MKKQLVIFLIIFVLTIAVPVIVCTIVSRQDSNQELVGIFRNVENIPGSLIPCVFGNLF